MLIVRIKNYIFKDPRSIKINKAEIGDRSVVAVFINDGSAQEEFFTISGTEGTTHRDILGMSEAIGREIGRKCAESPLPHMFINLDKVIADFWGNRIPLRNALHRRAGSLVCEEVK